VLWLRGSTGSDNPYSRKTTHGDEIADLTKPWNFSATSVQRLHHGTHLIFFRHPADCEIGFLHFTQRSYLLYTSYEKSRLVLEVMPSYDLRFVKSFESPNFKHVQFTEGFCSM